MASVKKISIALPEEMVLMLRECIKSGEYSSTSEVIRDALRHWKLKRKIELAEIEELRELIKEGELSGPGVSGCDVFKSLKKKYGG